MGSLSHACHEIFLELLLWVVSVAESLDLVEFPEF